MIRLWILQAVAKLLFVKEFFFAICNDGENLHHTERISRKTKLCVGHMALAE